MMQNTQPSRAAATNAQKDLKNHEMPSINSTSWWSKLTSVFAMSVALASEPALAQSPTNAPTTPTPATAPATPGYRVLSEAEAQQYIAAQVPDTNAGPAAPGQGGGVVKDPTKALITVIKDKPFCMDDDGNILTLKDRRLQVRHPGQIVEGRPSKGECLRAIAEGVAYLKQMNGGVIPDGCNVKVVVYRQGGEAKSYLNPNVIPEIVQLSPATFRAAMADPLTEEAIMSLHEGIHIHVRNVGGLMTMTYKDKKGNRPIALTVELEKR